MKAGYLIMEQQRMLGLGYWTTDTGTLVMLEYDLFFNRATTAFLVNGNYQDERTTKVHATESGRGYIVRHGKRYYDDQWIKNV